MERRLEFKGSGGDLFVKFLVGFLLSTITLGIYVPWFVVGLIRYVFAHTTLKRPGAEDVTFEFTGGGGQLFVKLLVGWILTMITLGIYGAWFACDMGRWFADHCVGRTAGGQVYGIRFNGKGGDLLGLVILGVVLSMVTLGIYIPWFVVNLKRWRAENTDLLEAGQKTGAFGYDGKGGEFFVLILVGALLTFITLGIYAAWFQVKQIRFHLEHTRLQAGPALLTGGFTGTGGQLFVKVLVGTIVTSVTLGIYAPWFVADLLKWNLESALIKGGAAAVPGSALDRPAPFA